MALLEKFHREATVTSTAQITYITILRNKYFCSQLVCNLY